MRDNYLICYDIANKKRLNKVFRYLKARGVHLQYSVFFCSFTRVQFKEAIENLNRLIDKGKDDVRIYPLPGVVKVSIMGKGSRLPEGVVYGNSGSFWDA
ncbi:MAG: CRISPR-associated endonuclease Cas2 [Nitrospinota bacterium]|jgi:CRISPR-associated protein Cas2